MGVAPSMGNRWALVAPALACKKLSIQARKPFSVIPVAPSYRQLRAFIDDVRTVLDEPDEAAHLARNLKRLPELCEQDERRTA